MRAKRMRGYRGSRCRPIGVDAFVVASFSPSNLQPAAWFDPGYTYKDTGGATQATAESDAITLAIYPGDNSTAPTRRYASNASNNPTLHIDGSGRKWMKGGTNLRLVFSSNIVQTLATDFYIATVVNRANASTVCPWGGSAGTGAILFSDNNLYVNFDTGSFTVPYTGNNGDTLFVLSNEAGSLYLQASGMAKTLAGTLATSTVVTLSEILARSFYAQYTDSTNYVGPQVFLQRTPSAGEIASLCGAGGYFDLTRGVHL